MVRFQLNHFFINGLWRSRYIFAKSMFGFKPFVDATEIFVPQETFLVELSKRKKNESQSYSILYRISWDEVRYIYYRFLLVDVEVFMDRSIYP